MQDLHNHTIWSDGSNTIEQIYLNAKNNGIEYIGISDHYHYIRDKDLYIKELSLYPVKKSVEIEAMHINAGKVDIQWCNKNLDYVIIENFYMPMHIPVITSLFTIPVIAAHPKPSIIPYMVNTGVFYEINLMIPIPTRATMKEIAKNKIKVTVGSDLHSLKDYKLELLIRMNKLADVMNSKHYCPSWFQEPE